MPTSIQAVTIDAAGTLIAPAEPVSTTYARIAGAYGIDVRPMALGQAFRTHFPRMQPLAFGSATEAELDRLERRWWRTLVERVLGPAATRSDRFSACFDALYAYYASASAWRVYAEIPDVLSTLDELGLKLAVVSNFDSRLFDILDGHGLSSAFETVLASSRVGAAKPDRRIFTAALSALDTSAERTLHIGDNPVADVQGAREAGLHAVLVKRKDADSSGEDGLPGEEEWNESFEETVSTLAPVARKLRALAT